MGPKPPRARPGADLFWAHVTAFGALWGSIEITLGSFLHSLRLPFGGTLLASLGAMLLVAARQILPWRGATLCTAIVAALCKSISPGGVILGPMVAIATEGLLVELALLLAPRSRLSSVAAGSLCALWSTFQKVITQVVYYGAGVLSLYLAALRRGRDWLGLPASAGWWAVVVILAVVLVLGGGAGLLGRRIGQRSREQLDGERGVALEA